MVVQATGRAALILGIGSDKGAIFRVYYRVRKKNREVTEVK